MNMRKKNTYRAFKSTISEMQQKGVGWYGEQSLNLLDLIQNTRIFFLSIPPPTFS